jgi:hypothetical protein
MAFSASWTAACTMASVRVITTRFCPPSVITFSAVSFQRTTSLAAAGAVVMRQTIVTAVMSTLVKA